MSEITIQTLQPGCLVKYGDKKSKVYKVDESKGRVLIAVIVGIKNWVPITSIEPWVEE